MTQNPPTNVEGFTIVDDFLFRRTRLCIPNTSLRDNLFWEIHAGGIVGHFGRDKTIILMKDRFSWPSVGLNVVRIVSHCRMCQVAKGRKQNTTLYTFTRSFCILRASPYYFILGLPGTLRKHDLIFVVVNRFFKMAHFTPYSKTVNTSHVAHLFFF